MFTVSPDDIQAILAAFGIRERVLSAEELLRYRYERYDPDTKEVRLILKLCFSHAAPLVIKFKNEAGVTQTLMSQQISFSEHLADRGIPTARFHRAKDAFVVPKTLNGYDVLITVERYRPGEIKSVNPAVAQQIGRLLAAAHNIAEADDCHVNGAVLFDPFKENDLFSFERFEKTAAAFTGGDASRFLKICETCRARMNALSPLREKKRYAVQGDLSNNNLFRTEHGEIGMFDFNRCGDNVLFCDALMQGVLIARLMDYDQGLTEDYEREMLCGFLVGYHAVRPFSAFELRCIPHLYAIVTAFWLMDLIYADESLVNLIEAGSKEKAALMLGKIETRIAGNFTVGL